MAITKRELRRMSVEELQETILERFKLVDEDDGLRMIGWWFGESIFERLVDDVRDCEDKDELQNFIIFVLELNKKKRSIPTYYHRR